MEMARPEKVMAGESAAPPAFATPAPQLSSVEDLQRRLKMIGDSPDPAPAAGAATLKPAPKPAPPAPAAAAPVQGGGKTALLVRFCGSCGTERWTILGCSLFVVLISIKYPKWTNEF